MSHRQNPGLDIRHTDPEDTLDWVYHEVHQERIRAHLKHDDQDPAVSGFTGSVSMERQDFDHPLWGYVLGEEKGEVDRAVIDGRILFGITHRTAHGITQLRRELVQVAAMAVAWIAAIDDDDREEMSVRCGVRDLARLDPPRCTLPQGHPGRHAEWRSQGEHRPPVLQAEWSGDPSPGALPS